MAAVQVTHALVASVGHVLATESIWLRQNDARINGVG